MFIEKQTRSQGRLKESDYELRERRNKWKKELATLQQRCSSMYTTSIRQHRILKGFLDRGINPELFLSYLLLYLPWSINTHSLENLSPVPFVPTREYSLYEGSCVQCADLVVTFCVWLLYVCPQAGLCLCVW